MGEHFGWQQIKDPDTRQIIRGLQEANIKKHKELEKLEDNLRKLVEEIRTDQYEAADWNIWYSDGCRHSADRIEELLKRGE